MTEIYTEFIHQTSRELARLLLSKLPIEQLEQVQYKDQEAKAILTSVGQAAMRLVFYPLDSTKSHFRHTYTNSLRPRTQSGPH